MAGAIAPEAGAPADVGQDPTDIVDAAVADGTAAPERQPTVTPPDKAALVREWWQRTAETADFDSAVKQTEKDLETIEGGTVEETSDDAEITVNHAYRNAIQTVALTVPDMQSVKWKPREEVEPLPGMAVPAEVMQRRRRQQGLAAVVTILFHRFAELGFVQEKVEAYVQDSVHFRMSIFKTWFQRDLGTDPIGEERLPDEQDLIAKARVLVELYDRGEFTQSDARYAQMRECLNSIGKTELDVRRGIVVELVPLRQYRCDPAVTGPEHHHTAAWERNDVLYTRDEVLAKWPHIGVDDLTNAKVYAVDETGRAVRQAREQQTTTTREIMSARNLPDMQPKGDDWLLCAEIYDYQTNTRLVLVEGLEFPAVEEPIVAGPTGMSPFVILVENRRPRSLYGFSDTELQAKTQRQRNRLRSQEEDSRRNAQPRWAYDPAAINDAKVIKAIETAAPWSMIPVPIAKGSIKDAIFPLAGNHEHNPQDFDDSKLAREQDKMAMLPEQATGVTGTANFSSEVQVAAAGANALARYRQTRILRALKRLYDKIAQLILLNVPQELAVRYCGPLAAVFYPAQPMDRREIYDCLEIEVEIALDKQLDYARRADSLAKFIDVLAKAGVQLDRDTAAKLLGKFMGIDEAKDLVQPDPNDLVGRLMQAMQEKPETLAPEALAALIQLGQFAQQQALQQLAQQAAAAPQPGGQQQPGAPMAPGQPRPQLAEPQGAGLPAHGQPPPPGL